MSKPTSKKPAFAMATMSNLAAASGEATNEPMVLRLVDVEPDPNQPRKIFDPEPLESMAASIKIKGVVNPISVQPGSSPGKWQIVDGERRWTASKIAGKADIPAFLASADQRDHATQVIANQQRQSLTNSEVAKAVIVESAAGRTAKEIAAIFNLKEYLVSYYRAVAKFPPFLTALLDKSDLRGCYDLFRQWEKTPEAVEKSLVLFPDGLTYLDAQRVVSGLSGKAVNSGFARADTAKAQLAAAASIPPLQPVSNEVAVQAAPQTPSEPAVEPVAESTGPKVAPAAKAAPGPSSAPPEQVEAAKAALSLALKAALPAPAMPFRLFVKASDGEPGLLLTNERAKDPGSVIVLFGNFREEVPAEGLQVVGIE